MEIDSSSEMKSMTRLLSSACHRSFPASHAHGVVTSSPQGTVCSQGSLVDRNMNSYFYPDRSHSDLWFAYRAHWWNRQLTSCLTCITWHLPFLLMLLFFFSRALFSPHSKLPCLSRQSEALLPICIYIWTARAFLYSPKEGYIIKVIFTFHKEESLHIHTHNEYILFLILICSCPPLLLYILELISLHAYAYNSRHLSPWQFSPSSSTTFNFFFAHLAHRHFLRANSNSLPI